MVTWENGEILIFSDHFYIYIVLKHTEFPQLKRVSLLVVYRRCIEMCLHFKSWLIPEVKEEKIAYQDYSWSTLASDFFCMHFAAILTFLPIFCR